MENGNLLVLEYPHMIHSLVYQSLSLGICLCHVYSPNNSSFIYFLSTQGISVPAALQISTVISIAHSVLDQVLFEQHY